MKKLVGFGGGHPLALDDLLYIQESTREITSRICRSLLGGGSTPLILWGAVVTKTGNDYTNTDGAIWYNGETYYVTASTSTITDLSKPKFVVQDNDDPSYDDVIYQDGTSHAIYKYRTLKLMHSSTSGDGFDYDLAKIDVLKNGLKGGATGQLARKKSNTDYDFEFFNIHEFPAGGTAGQVWSKDSNDDYDGSFKNEVELTPLVAVNGTAFVWMQKTRYGLVTLTGRLEGVNTALSAANIFNALLPPPYGDGVEPITVIADKEGVGVTFMKLYPDGRFSPGPGGSGTYNINFSFSYLSVL